LYVPDVLDLHLTVYIAVCTIEWIYSQSSPTYHTRLYSYTTSMKETRSRFFNGSCI